MYFRLAPRKHGDVTYTYLQLVEAYREGGKNRQRVLYSFGNVEELREDGQLSRLVDSLQRATGAHAAREPGLDALQTGRVLEYGGLRLAQALWEQFGLTELLRQQLAGRRFRFDAVAAIATVVFNRLLAPKSELGIFAWRDRNWWPEFAATPPELEHLYRALDALIEIKRPLEEALFARLQHLFNLQVDVVFYDLTSSYFEGDGPPLARYGYSRDKRSDRKQVLLALACEEHGFPIAHEVLAGNRADSTTVQDMVRALQERFSLRRVIFVSDSGMVSQANLQALDAAGYEYLVAMRKRNVSEAERHAPADLTSYEEGPHKVRVFVSDADTPGARYVCCWSAARAEEERQIRDARLAKGQAALQKLADQVAAGRLKLATKIAARAATALQRAPARSYFRYEATDGRFEFGVKDEQLAKEQRLEGRYFLLTNAARLTADQAVEAYFTLQEVERAFREMKDFLKLRPIYHWTDRRVQAHIFACVLAYLLERSLSYQLRTAGVALSAQKAVDFASRVHAVENTIGEQTLWTVSRPAPQAQQVFKAVGIDQLPTVLDGYQPPPDE